MVGRGEESVISNGVEGEGADGWVGYDRDKGREEKDGGGDDRGRVDDVGERRECGSGIFVVSIVMCPGTDVFNVLV